MDAFTEAMELRDCIKHFGALDEWTVAAERFADYWTGDGTWRDMSSERRTAFAEALKPNFHEWDAVLNETTSLDDWAAQLPPASLLVCDPGTVRPIRELNALLRRSRPDLTYEEVRGAGHMAPLTRPDMINPLVASFLGDRR
jgi:pimeloyl-ACP methyl ester carboxylesterase